MTNVVPTMEWSSPVTLTTDEDWFVVGAPVLFSVNAVPASLSDGGTVQPGDVYQFRAGEVIRYRLKFDDPTATINRQVRT